MARIKESIAVVPTTDKEKALAIVSAYFDGKKVEMKDPEHGVRDWTSVRSPLYWSYLGEFCSNVDKYRIVE